MSEVDARTAPEAPSLSAASGPPIGPKPRLRRFHQARWDEPIIFELSVPGARGILPPSSDPAMEDVAGRPWEQLPAQVRRESPPALPELSQLHVLRHYLRLSQETLGVDLNIDIGQGTCTMKYSPNEQMEGGEVFVPKIPSTKVVDLAKAIVPNAKINIIGIRPGEKLHEDLISEDEARHTIELEKMYVIQPAEATWFGYSWKDKGKPLPDNYRYTSDNNAEWLDIDGIKKFVAPFEELFKQGKLEG